MSYSAPEPGPTNQPEPQQPYPGQPTAVLQATGQEPSGQGWGQPQTPEPFVPKKRFKMGRLTQILLAVLLVAVGFFAGVGVTKAMDAGQARPGRGQFQNFNGGQGRNRQSGAPTNGASPTAIPSAPATSAP
ncbi:hypothetical protein ACX801_18355 [Arthrobacter bambusae]|uniref:hypothetical protein n=1 Tax=Arthrobacter sp. NPDC058127 TaxID=3346351 RepID=UPI0036F0728D